MEALAWGALAGAGLTALPFIVVAILAFVCALVLWATGLALVTPIWWGLDRLGIRHWGPAVALGGIASPVAMTLVIGGGSFLGAALLSATGMIVGYVVWAKAYQLVTFVEGAQ